MKFGLSCDRSGLEFGLSCDRSGVKFGLSCDRSGVKSGLSCDRTGILTEAALTFTSETSTTRKFSVKENPESPSTNFT